MGVRYRYSGDTTITIRMRETAHGAIYECTLRDATEEARVQVGSPRVLVHAIDSPEAMDAAAHAGISFAVDEGHAFEGVDYRPDGSGYLITRSKVEE